MPFNFLKKQKGETKNEDRKMNVVIISAACCVPGMDAFDNQARKVIDQAISETGIEAKVTLVPATTAMFAFNKVIRELMVMQGNGKIGVPAVLIEGEAVSYGVPQIDDMKAALKKFSDLKK